MSLVLRRDAETGSPRFSVAVPVRNGGPRLLTLLAAVDRPDVELLIADSGSTDGAVEEATTRFPTLRVWDVPAGTFNHGLTRAALVREARAPLVALFSQDAVPLGARYLDELAQPFSDPSVVGATARQVPRPGAGPLTAATLRRWTPPGSEAVVLRLGSRAWAELSPAEQLALCRFDNVASMVRRGAMVDLPFPERPFGEDLAWAAAVIRSGLALAYVPTALVEHHHDASLRGHFERHRIAHQQVSREFAQVSVPSLLALPGALAGSLRRDTREVGLRRAVAASPQRLAELLGQWAGGR